MSVASCISSRQVHRFGIISWRREGREEKEMKSCAPLAREQARLGLPRRTQHRCFFVFSVMALVVCFITSIPLGEPAGSLRARRRLEKLLTPLEHDMMLEKQTKTKVSVATAQRKHKPDPETVRGLEVLEKLFNVEHVQVTTEDDDVGVAFTHPAAHMVSLATGLIPLVFMAGRTSPRRRPQSSRLSMQCPACVRATSWASAKTTS